MRPTALTAVVYLGYVALLSLDGWLLPLRPEAPWDKKVAAVLGIVGVYSFAIAFLAETKILETLKTLGDDLTSPEARPGRDGVDDDASDDPRDRPQPPGHDPESASGTPVADMSR
jgi:hypothetical protein